MSVDPIDRYFLAWRESDREEDALEWIRLALPPLYSLALRLCANRADADEAVQECLFRAIRAKDTFAHRSSVLSWLLRILATAATDAARQRRRVRLRPAVCDAAPARVADEDCSEERIRAAQEEVNKLPDGYRLSLELTLVAELTGQEAARALRVSVGTLHWRAHVARERIRQGLRRRGYVLSVAELPALLNLRSAPMPAGDAAPALLRRALTRGAVARRAVLLTFTAAAAFVACGIVALDRTPSRTAQGEIAAMRVAPGSALDETPMAVVRDAATKRTADRAASPVVSGRLRTPGSQPGSDRGLENGLAELTAGGRVERIRTDGQGRFVLAAPRGARSASLRVCGGPFTTVAERFLGPEGVPAPGAMRDGWIELGDVFVLPAGVIEGRCALGASSAEGIVVLASDRVRFSEGRATLERDGSFRLENLLPGRYELFVATADARTSAGTAEVRAGETTAVSFKAPAVRTRHVRFALAGTGAPLAGAEIFVVGSALPPLVADASGRVTIATEAESPDELTFEISHPSVRRGVESAVRFAAPESEQRVDVPAAPFLEVRVVDAATGLPARATRAWLGRSPRTAETASASDTLKIPIRERTKGDAGIPLVVFADGLAPALALVPPGATAQEVRAERPVTVSGSVVVGEDASIPRHGRISLAWNGAVLASAPLDDRGRFELRGAPSGELRMIVRVEGCTDEERKLSIVPGTEHVRTGELRLARSGGFDIVLDRREPALVRIKSVDSKAVVFQDRLEPQGRRPVRDLGPGPYLFEVISPREGSATATRMERCELAPGRIVQVSLGDEPRATIRGVVADRTISPALLTIALLGDTDPWYRSVDASPDGTFEFAGVAAGSYVVAAFPRGPLADNLDRAPFERGELLAKRLADAALLRRSVVVDGAGEASVDLEGAIPHCLLDLSPLAGQPLLLEVASAEDPSQPLLRLAAPESPEAKTLTVPSGNYRLLLRGADGAPVSTKTIRATAGSSFSVSSSE